MYQCANMFLIQGDQLLAVFQQTMPPESFMAVMDKLPTAKHRLAERFERAATLMERSGGAIVQEMMADEELE